ncbi:MAG: hypothetical protein ABIB47_00180 [Candidatus Woesearchaeota archaeon]
MRKIVSKGKSEKKEKRNRKIIGIALLSIMVLSVFGFVALDFLSKTGTNPDKITYKGIDFIRQQERWFFSQNGIEFSILNSPENLTDIFVPENLASFSSYSQMPLYIYSKDKSLEAKIYFNFNSVASRIQQGCLNGTDCNGDFPIKTCEDKFILILESNETSIVQEQNCVFISAPETKEMQMALDAFFLKITGVN